MLHWSTIFPENRFPPRITSGAGFFAIVLWRRTAAHSAADFHFWLLKNPCRAEASRKAS
jgi:hypothetical protein